MQRLALVLNQIRLFLKMVHICYIRLAIQEVNAHTGNVDQPRF